MLNISIKNNYIIDITNDLKPKIACRDMLVFNLNSEKSTLAFKLKKFDDVNILLKVVTPNKDYMIIEPKFIIGTEREKVFQIVLDNELKSTTGKYPYQVVINNEVVMNSMYQVIDEELI